MMRRYVPGERTVPEGLAASPILTAECLVRQRQMRGSDHKNWRRLEMGAVTA